jgi:hypothetical protein
VSEAIRVDQYALVRAEDSGQYGWKIIEGWENQAGEFKINFCKRSFKKGGEEKLVPVSVKLGDQATATGVLLMLLQQVSGKTYVEESAPF